MTARLPFSPFSLNLTRIHMVWILGMLGVLGGLGWEMVQQVPLQAQVVPYDAYARPYSWPMTGKILQDYGLTDAAQNLGSRYPDLYPKGDPGTVFSITNQISPPLSANDKFINPNVDIEPNSQEAGSRAVYATHAGWLTFADWAGEGKGYSIQLESDVDGDGQSDYATRYMHLQAPQDGFFAPDIPILPASTGADTTTGSTGTPVAVTPFVLEAEGMDRSGSEVKIISDQTASGGKAVSLQSNGALTTTTTQRADQLIIYAKGSQCLGAPNIIVRQDGLPLMTLPITATDTWGQYSLEAAFDGGSHRLSLQYTNDQSIPLGCDRNLWIDKVHMVVTNPNAPVTTNTGIPALVEAETLTSDSAQKPKVVADAAASPEGHGQNLTFTSNGTASGSFAVDQANWIVVRAKGEACDGAPRLSLKVDNAEVFNLEVTATSWTNYSTSFQLASGGQGNQHTVSISFTNDKTRLIPACDRNLMIDRILFEQVVTAQTTTNLHSLIGKTKYVAFNQLLGYVSTNRTFEHPGADISKIPNANQSYLSYRIMYNNPSLTTFPTPNQPDSFVEARVDNPYIVETSDNTIAGSLKDVFDLPNEQMFFFCAKRQTGEAVRCIYAPNPV